MCRSKSKGGRRCPAHSDPVRRAAYNARRRERRRQAKITQVMEKEEEYTFSTDNSESVGDSLTAKVRNSGSAFDNKKSYTYEHYTDDGRYYEYKDEELLRYTDSTTTNDRLKITSQKLEGKLADMRYFQPQRITGIINTNNLDEYSYLDFGFREVGDNINNRRIDAKNKNYVDNSYWGSDVYEVSKLSKMEIENSEMTDDERQSLKVYTTSLYSSINDVCYDPKSLEFVDSYSPGTEMIDPEVFYNGFYNSSKDIWYTQISQEFITRTIDELDNALSRGPQQQRVVYRGISAESEFFHNEEVSPEEIPGWLDENRAIGSEVVFEGYSSSTIDPDVAIGDYAGDSGVLYEILTPEGINLTHTSKFQHEKEVLLPRQQRYVVVGVHKNVGYVDNHGVSRNLHLVQLVAVNNSGEILDGSNSRKVDKIEF